MYFLLTLAIVGVVSALLILCNDYSRIVRDKFRLGSAICLLVISVLVGLLSVVVSVYLCGLTKNEQLMISQKIKNKLKKIKVDLFFCCQ